MIKNKFYVAGILLFLLAVSSYAIYSDLSTLYEKVHNIDAVRQKLSQISSFQKIIKELQKERGLVTIYKSDSSKDVYKSLIQQQKTTQGVIKKHSKNIVTKTIMSNLEMMQEEAFDKSTTQNHLYLSYTNTILDLLRENKKLILYTNNSDIKNRLLKYQKLSLIQEYFGELRAAIGAIVGNKKRYKEFFPCVYKTDILLQNSIEDLAAYLQADEMKNFNVLLHQSPAILKVENVVKMVLLKKLDALKLHSLQWFMIATKSVDKIYKHNQHCLHEVIDETEMQSVSLKRELAYHIVFWLISVLVGISTLFALYRKEKEIAQKNQFLSDYKKAIDNSTIVSKTDKRGVITYANKAFCEISGYTEEELLGKPHNTVRHPDMPKEAFRQMWQTIKSGQTWQGEVKNLKKDGGYYWVQATISPIYDNKNNLVEYVAIRQDITALINLSEEIQNTQKELIYRIGESVESRSKETGNHIRRVAKYAELLGKLYGLDTNTCETLSIASTMHDVGKIAIPDAILLKPGKLDRDEFEIMKTHAYIGYKILSGSKLPILQMAAEIAYGHHERYTGGGYPRNISGDAISIYARIVAVADVFDALIFDRIYKKSWDLQRVITLFKEEKGKQFDPKIVELLLTNIDDFMAIKRKYEE